MKFKFIKLKIVLILLSIIIVGGIKSQGPLTSGSVDFSNYLYHKKSLGIGSSATPKARIHIFNGTTKLAGYTALLFKNSRPFLITGKVDPNLPPSPLPTFPIKEKCFFTVDSKGFVGVDILDPTEKLEVKNGNVLVNNGDLYIRGDNPNTIGDNQILLRKDGLIRAREIKVDLQQIPDYVFLDDYNLLSIYEVENFIQKNKHLPNVKSEEEFKEEGSISIAELNLKLLEKVEELTLYIIDLQKQIDNIKIK